MDMLKEELEEAKAFVQRLVKGIRLVVVCFTLFGCIAVGARLYAATSPCCSSIEWKSFFFFIGLIAIIGLMAVLFSQRLGELMCEGVMSGFGFPHQFPLSGVWRCRR